MDRISGKRNGGEKDPEERKGAIIWKKRDGCKRERGRHNLPKVPGDPQEERRPNHKGKKKLCDKPNGEKGAGKKEGGSAAKKKR